MDISFEEITSFCRDITPQQGDRPTSVMRPLVGADGWSVQIVGDWPTRADEPRYSLRVFPGGENALVEDVRHVLNTHSATLAVRAFLALASAPPA